MREKLINLVKDAVPRAGVGALGGAALVSMLWGIAYTARCDYHVSTSGDGSFEKCWATGAAYLGVGAGVAGASRAGYTAGLYHPVPKDAPLPRNELGRFMKRTKRRVEDAVDPREGGE